MTSPPPCRGPLLATSLALAFLTCASPAEHLDSESSPSENAAPNDPQVHADKLADLGTWLETLVSERQVAGAAVLVGSHGQTLYRRAAGESVVGSGIDLEPDAIFRIYSMTKPITSLAAMMLVQEGSLDLEAPVSDYLPAFAHPRVARFPPGPSPVRANMTLEPARGTMLVRNLLNHTSGLIYGIFADGPMAEFYDEANLWERGIDLDTFVERVATLPLASEPGTKFTYSISADVLGAVIQAASGMPFERFLAERIFQPLGMRDTGFFVPPDKVERFAELYYRVADRVVLRDTEGRAAFLRPDALPSGGGGLVSTLDDYAKFCALIAGGGACGGVQLLSPASFAEMTSPPAPGSPADVAFPDGIGFALGYMVIDDGSLFGAPLSTGQLSWGGMACTEFFVHPGLDLYGVFMTQVLPSSNEFQLPFLTRVYAAVGDPKGE